MPAWAAEPGEDCSLDQASPIALAWDQANDTLRLWIDGPLDAGDLTLTAVVAIGDERLDLSTTPQTFLGVGHVDPPLPTTWPSVDAADYVTDYHLTVTMGPHTSTAPAAILTWPDGPTGSPKLSLAADMDILAPHGVLDPSLAADLDDGVRLLPSPEQELPPPPPSTPSQADTGVAP